MRKGVRKPHIVVNDTEDTLVFSKTLKVTSLQVRGLQGPDKALALLQRYGLQTATDPSDQKLIIATPTHECTILVQLTVGRGNGGPLRLCRTYYDDFAIAQTGNFWLLNDRENPSEIEAVTGDFSEVSIKCSPTDIVPRFVVLTRRDQALEQGPAEIVIPESALR